MPLTLLASFMPSSRLLQNPTSIIKSLRHHAITIVLFFLRNKELTVTWKVDKVDVLSYKIQNSPFDFRCVFNHDFYKVMKRGEPLFIFIPQWFEYVDNHVLDDITDDNVTKTYCVSVQDNMFQLRRNGTTKIKSWDLTKYRHLESDNPQFIEGRLCGFKDSLFERTYPEGIDITAFLRFLIMMIKTSGCQMCNSFNHTDDISGWNMKSDYHSHGEDEHSFKLYQLYPYLLYGSICNTHDILPYDKESMYITLLEDDTFDVKNLYYNTCL